MGHKPQPKSPKWHSKNKIGFRIKMNLDKLKKIGHASKTEIKGC